MIESIESTGKNNKEHYEGLKMAEDFVKSGGKIQRSVIVKRKPTKNTINNKSGDK